MSTRSQQQHTIERARIRGFLGIFAMRNVRKLLGQRKPLEAG